MKTIVRKESNISLYLFSDDVVVNIDKNNTIVGNPPEMIISDCDKTNTILFENVTDPDDWSGWKYTYTEETGWVLNPGWQPPEPL